MESVKIVAKIAVTTLAGGALMGLVVLAFASLSNQDVESFQVVKGAALGAAIAFVQAIG